MQEVARDAGDVPWYVDVFKICPPPPGRILNGRDIRGCATALLLDQSRGGTLYGAIRGIRVLELSWIWTLLK